MMIYSVQLLPAQERLTKKMFPGQLMIIHYRKLPRQKLIISINMILTI